MNNADALFDDFQDVERRQTVVAVRMKLDRNVAGIVQDRFARAC